MPLTLADLENKPFLDEIKHICVELELDDLKCSRLRGFVEYLMESKPRKGKRTPSRWQLCLAEQRKGKPFDPSAIKEVAKLYREGKCPSR